MKNTLRIFTALSLLLSLSIVQAAALSSPIFDEGMTPTGKGWGEHKIRHTMQKDPSGSTGTAQTTVPQNGIAYHNGSVMLGSPTVYYIWYGNWANNTAPSILENFAIALGGSPYHNISTSYFDSTNTHVSNALIYGGSSNAANYPLGKNLSDKGVWQVVTGAINSGQLPKNNNAIYLVLTTPDVGESSGFCSKYCAWHSYGTMGATQIKFGFIGSPQRCPNACAAQKIGPNDNANADSMASLIAHETEESITDPTFTGWYDSKGLENADKCAWTFGSMFKTSNGAFANVTLGGMNFLIQQNWVNANGGYCALSY